MDDEEKARRVAIGAMAERAAVPLIVEKDGQSEVCGTGTFFELEGVFCLVTAAHVGKYIGEYKIGVPILEDQRTVWTLGRGRTVYTEKYDICLFFPHQEEAIDTVKRAWRVLTEENVYFGNIETEVTAFLVGYPNETSEQLGLELASKPILISTRPCASVDKNGFTSSDPYDPEVDLLLEHSKAPDYWHSDSEMPIPALQGISGCSVWVLGDGARSEGVWTPDRDAKVVAVETSYRPGHWIRCRKWSVVIRTILSAHRRVVG